MANVALSTYGGFVSGSVPFANAMDAVVASPAQADTYTLPVGVPVGYHFHLVNTTANVITVAAGVNETITGAVATTTANSKLHLIKTTATAWRGYLST